MIKKLLMAVLAIIFILVGAFFYFSPKIAISPSLAGNDAQNAVAQGVPVSVVTIEKSSVERTITLPGRVTALKQSQVRPQVDGIITERLFEEGASVEKGQQLYQIDDTRYNASLASAKADLASAKADVKAVEAKEKRYRDLVKINAVSKQEYDDVKADLDKAKASVDVAQAAVDVAQINLDYTKVYAPISGKIGRSQITEGSLVTANQTDSLAVITQMDPVYVDMQQSGTDGIALRMEMSSRTEPVKVSVSLDNEEHSQYPEEGVLKFSEVTVDETTGSVAMRAVMPNSKGVLLPGLFVKATLKLGSEDVLTVPQRATTRKPNGSLQVWTVNSDNQAVAKTVEVSKASGDNWIVSSGLKEGDIVIVEGTQKLAANTPVVTSEWSEQE